MAFASTYLLHLLLSGLSIEHLVTNCLNSEDVPKTSGSRYVQVLTKTSPDLQRRFDLKINFQKEIEKQDVGSVFVTLGQCFGTLCCFCCPNKEDEEEKGKELRYTAGGDPMTRVRLGFKGKDMWIETRGLNFHQTFGRYAVLMDDEGRIVPFTKNGEAFEELDPSRKYNIVANRYGGSDERWKKHKETESTRLKKQRKLNSSLSLPKLLSPPSPTLSSSPSNDDLSPLMMEESAEDEDEDLEDQTSDFNSMDLDQFLALPTNSPPSASGLPRAPPKIKLRILVEFGEKTYERSIEGTSESLKSLVSKINTKVKSLSSLSLNMHRTGPMNTPKDTRIFGVPLDIIMDRQKVDPSKIPIFMKHSLKHLFVHALGVEGIFRISGSQADVVAKKTLIDKGDTQFTKEDNPHLVTGLLKQYLRELPEPLCTAELYDLFLASADLIIRNQPLDMLKKTIGMLPINNKNLFQHLFHFLTFVASNSNINLMTASNLGRIFGPNLFWKKETGPVDMQTLTKTSDKVNLLCEKIIMHYNEMFEEPLQPVNGGRLAIQNKMLGHKKSVQWLALADSDRHVCSLDTVGNMKIWDSQTCELINEFSVCEQGAVVYHMVAASNDTIWTATSQSVSVWTLSGQLIGEVPGECYSLCESQNRDMWVGGNQVMSIYSLDDVPCLASEVPIKPIGLDLFNQGLFVLSLCRVGKNRIWGCSSDKKLYVWDAKTKEILHQTEIQEKRPKRMAYIETEDMECVWIGGDEGTVQILDVKTYKLIHKINNGGWDKIFVLATIGKEIWSSTWDIVVRVWDPKPREITAEIKGNHADAISAILEVPNLKTGEQTIWFASLSTITNFCSTGTGLYPKMSKVSLSSSNLFEAYSGSQSMATVAATAPAGGYRGGSGFNGATRS
eukprot:gene3744-4318_t